jgi:SAM-dependent methyltransferase
MAMDWYRVAFGELYPLLYSHRDDEEAAAAARRIAPLLQGRSPVLDVACGAGRYMTAFGDAGLEVFGIDLSEYLLIEAVERRGHAGRVVVADMRVLPVRDASVGAVTNMFTSFGYFESDGDNERVLDEIARVLVPGGRFVLDYLNAGAIHPESLASTTRIVEGAVVHETRTVEGANRVLVKHVRVELDGRPDVEFSERVRLFSVGDLGRMAGAAGLSMLSLHGDYDLGAYDASTSPRSILLCEKKGTAPR